MAHNPHFNPLRNEHFFFTVQEKAWHGLGKVIEHYPNSEMALRYAGIDFEVLKRPDRQLLDDGTVFTSSESFFTYREDTEEILGSKLGRKYEVVQNTDAFAFFDSIVGGDGIFYKTAGGLGMGERVFITAKLPGYIMVQNRDLIEKYLFLTTSHDGSGAIMAAFTPVRIVCNNTLNMAMRNCESRITIRHTRDARNRWTTDGSVASPISYDSVRNPFVHPLNLSPMNTISLWIVNRNPFFLEALVLVLNEHWQFRVTFSVRTYRDFLNRLADEEPDLILMDDNVLKELTHQDSSALLRYVRGIPIAVMGLEIPKHMHRYTRVHPAIEFLSKEHDRKTLVDRLIELAGNHLDMSNMDLRQPRVDSSYSPYNRCIWGLWIILFLTYPYL